MRTLLLLALSLALSLSPGCASHRGLGGEATLNHDSLADTTWRIRVPGGDPANAYVLLRADGVVGYNYAEPSNYAFEGDDTWRVDRGILVIRWTDGYAEERYPLMGGTTKFFGGKTSQSFEGEVPCTIERVP